MNETTVRLIARAMGGIYMPTETHSSTYALERIPVRAFQVNRYSIDPKFRPHWAEGFEVYTRIQGNVSLSHIAVPLDGGHSYAFQGDWILCYANGYKSRMVDQVFQKKYHQMTQDECHYYQIMNHEVGKSTMTKTAAEKITAGLKDAIDFVEGKDNGCVVHTPEPIYKEFAQKADELISMLSNHSIGIVINESGSLGLKDLLIRARDVALGHVNTDDFSIRFAAFLKSYRPSGATSVEIDAMRVAFARAINMTVEPAK